MFPKRIYSCWSVIQWDFFSVFFLTCALSAKQPWNTPLTSSVRRKGKTSLKLFQRVIVQKMFTLNDYLLRIDSVITLLFCWIARANKPHRWMSQIYDPKSKSTGKNPSTKLYLFRYNFSLNFVLRNSKLAKAANLDTDEFTSQRCSW